MPKPSARSARSRIKSMSPVGPPLLPGREETVSASTTLEIPRTSSCPASQAAGARTSPVVEMRSPVEVPGGIVRASTTTRPRSVSTNRRQPSSDLRGGEVTNPTSSIFEPSLPVRAPARSCSRRAVPKMRPQTAAVSARSTEGANDRPSRSMIRAPTQTRQPNAIDQLPGSDRQVESPSPAARPQAVTRRHSAPGQARADRIRAGSRTAVFPSLPARCRGSGRGRRRMRARPSSP